MNPPEFYGSKTEDDPQEFLDDIQKVTLIMGVTPVERAYLDTYQLKRLAHVGLRHGKRISVDTILT